MILSLYDIFKPWAAKGSIYIMSDTHFADEDCHLIDKDWPAPAEQVKILNRYAHKNDTLILLGDIGDTEYVKQLAAGHKVLIMGNHDATAAKFKGVFDEIYKGPLFISEKILLSHEPIYGLDFCLNIHGHDHRPQNKGDEYHLNLAANVCGYTPVSLAAVIKEGRLSKIESIHRRAAAKNY